MNSKSRRILNFILFQLGWWGSFFSAVQKIDFVFLAAFVAAVVGSHFYFVVNRRLRIKEFLFFVLVTPLGYLSDSFWHSLDILKFSWSYSIFPPLWLLGMWSTFPMAIGHSFSWLEGRYIVSFLIGSVGAPLCYRFGENFDLIAFNSLGKMTVYGVYWGILMVFLVRFKQIRFF